jgi:hypothetical protein
MARNKTDEEKVGKSRRERRCQLKAFSREEVQASQRLAYHMEEFKGLKTEIAELIKVSSGHLPYALLASAGIYSWLLTSKCSGTDKPFFPTGHVSLVWLLPLIISVIFGALALAARLRIGHIGEYIDRLEVLFALDGKWKPPGRSEHEYQFGWERYFTKRPPIVSGIYFCAWLLLLLGNIGIAFLMWNSQACA